MCRLAAATLSLALLVACQPGPAPLSNEDVAAIKSLGTSYAEANLAKDADAVAAVYSDDAVEMPPNEPVTQGRAAIRERYAGYFALDVTSSEFTVTSLEIDGVDGLAFDRGSWSWTGTPPGASWTVRCLSAILVCCGTRVLGGQGWFSP